MQSRSSDRKDSRNLRGSVNRQITGIALVFATVFASITAVPLAANATVTRNVEVTRAGNVTTITVDCSTFLGSDLSSRVMNIEVYRGDTVQLVSKVTNPAVLCTQYVSFNVQEYNGMVGTGLTFSDVFVENHVHANAKSRPATNGSYALEVKPDAPLGSKSQLLGFFAANSWGSYFNVRVRGEDPTITSVSPTSGFAGETLTITGTNFELAATVSVGGASCTNVAVVSSTSITCTTPVRTAGAKDVVVTNVVGEGVTRSVTSVGAFTYLSVIQPGVPGKPVATAGNGTAALTWTAPTTGTAPFTYSVTSSPVGATCTVSSLTASCTGLTNGTAYTFTSTATNAAGNSAASASSDPVTPSAPVVNSPSSDSGPTYRSVTFDSNGGTGTALAVSNYSTTALPANSLVKPGFVFTSWNTKADGTGIAYADKSTYDFSADATLYAQWVPVKSAAKVKKYISTFEGDRAVLKRSMKAEIASWIKRLPKNSSITCQGSTSGSKVTAFDKKLASNRATNVCDAAVKLRSDLTYSVQLNPSSANKASARHVWMIQN